MLAAAAALVALLGLGPAVPRAYDPAAPAQPAVERQDPPVGGDDKIAALRRQLGFPGPEARVQRETAVTQLLGMAELAAHEAVRDVLARQSDPDGLLPWLLDQLLARLRNPDDAVLGPRSGAAALQRRQLYLPELMLRFGRSLDPAAAVVGAASPAQPVLREMLLAFASPERVVAVAGLLADADPERRVLAARAAGGCRDFSVARELARHLDAADGALREAVRGSLRQLTFHEGDFSGQAEFEQWFVRVDGNGKTFLDLAEEAARRAQQSAQAERVQLLGALDEAVVELIQSYVERPEIAWGPLTARLVGEASQGSAEVYMECLRDLLRDREQLTGNVQERQALADALVERLDRARSSHEQAVLLELTAYLVVADESERQITVLARLQASLETGTAEVRRGALAGLRRFPRDPVRDQVIDTASQFRRDHQPELLAEALATLAAWPAPPSEGRRAWLELLQACLLDAELPVEVRRMALTALTRPDADGERVPEVPTALASLATEVAQDVSLREIALLRLADLTEAEQAEVYVQALVSCLFDGSDKVRRRAATSMIKLPVSSDPAQVGGWAQTLLDAARTRLLVENDEGVHRELTQSVRRIGELAGQAEPVVQLLTTQTRSLQERPADQRQPFRRKHMVEALRILASAQDREPELWLAAGEAIAAVGDRQALRLVLGRHATASSLAELEGETPAFAHRARLLVVATARLAPPEHDWSVAENQAEAEAVLAAVDALERSQTGALSFDLATVVLRMDLHAARGEHERVVALVPALPRALSSGPTEPLQQRAAQRAAAALLQRGDPLGARDWLMPLFDNGAQPPPGALALLLNVAQALVAGGDHAAAEPALEQIVLRTPDDAPELPARVLAYATAVFAADPARGPEVRRMLDEHAQRFAVDAVAEELRREYLGLRAALGPGADSRAPAAAVLMASEETAIARLKSRP